MSVLTTESMFLKRAPFSSSRGLPPTFSTMYGELASAINERFTGVSPLSLAMFLGNAEYETAHFTSFEENLYYVRADRILEVFPSKVKSMADAQRLTRSARLLGNTVYGNRSDLGNVNPTDGYDFRGRGFPHLTGRLNYTDAEAATGLPLVSNPDMIGNPTDATPLDQWAKVQAAVGEWFFRRCLPAANGGMFSAVVKKWTGSQIALERRRECFFAWAKLLGVM